MRAERGNRHSYHDPGSNDLGLAFFLVIPTKKWLFDRNLIQQGFF